MILRLANLVMAVFLIALVSCCPSTMVTVE